MKGDSEHFDKTLGAKSVLSTEKGKINFVKKVNKGRKNKIPEKIAQIDHIFRNSQGHLNFNKENVKFISDLINDEDNLTLKKDKYGKSWYTKITDEGYQLWGTVYNKKLSDGGLNKLPIKINPKTGLSKNKGGNK